MFHFEELPGADLRTRRPLFRASWPSGCACPGHRGAYGSESQFQNNRNHAVILTVAPLPVLAEAAAAEAAAA